MQISSLASPYTLSFSTTSWALSANGTDDVYITHGTVQYSPMFAELRALPADGLQTQDIRAAVLGFSESDQQWHLGLLLNTTLAAQRQSRWCPLMQWHSASVSSDDGGVQSSEPYQALQALAQVLGVPYQVVDRSDTSSKTKRKAVPLAALPLTTGQWTLVQDPAEDGTLRYEREKRWWYDRLARGVWYAVLTVVYVAVSIATLNSPLALPNEGMMLPVPQYLPYLGLFSAVIIVCLSIYHFWLAFTSADAFEFAPDGDVRTLRGTNVVRTTSVQDAARPTQGVYLTQLLSNHSANATVVHAVLNLWQGETNFQKLITFDPLQLPAMPQVTDDDGAAVDGVLPFNTDLATTPLQHAALHIAQTLGVPCYYDQRIR
jgi:hypothetical protein